MRPSRVSAEVVWRCYGEGVASFARTELCGELQVPWSFKPSSLIGDTVRTIDGPAKREFKISRAYTLRKYPWGSKRVKFVAEAV